MTSQNKINKGLYWDEALYLVHGCTKVDMSCFNCWAETLCSKFWNSKIFFDSKTLTKIEKIKPTTFAIWNDLFHETITTLQTDKVLSIINWFGENHTFLICTKRPHLIQKHIKLFLSLHKGTSGIDLWPKSAKNLWFGTSVYSDDEICRKRTATLFDPFLELPHRYLSIEPMLSKIDLYKLFDYDKYILPELIIIGCESGINRRKISTDKLDNVLFQAQIKHIKVFIKQWDFTGKKILKPKDFPDKYKPYTTLPF